MSKAEKLEACLKLQYDSFRVVEEMIFQAQNGVGEIDFKKWNENHLALNKAIFDLYEDQSEVKSALKNMEESLNKEKAEKPRRKVYKKRVL